MQVVLPGMERCGKELDAVCRKVWKGVLFRGCLLITLVLMPIVASAEVNEPFQAYNLIKTLLGLCVVIISIVCVAWAYKKFGSVGLSPNSNLKIESVLSLGHKEKILIVRGDQHRLLLSVTPGKVDTLMVLDDAQQENEAIDSKSPPEKPRTLVSIFQSNGERGGEQ